MNLPLRKNRLFLQLSAILITAFTATSLLGYVAARDAVREDIIHQRLPLTSDTVYSQVQRELLRPILIAEQMAENTFLREWVLAGETDNGPVVRYLREIKQHFKADTSFFVSERTRRYYHPLGVPQIVKRNDPKDAWYFRSRTMPEPYEINIEPDTANRDTLTVFIDYRLLDANGNFLGTTGIGMTMPSLTTTLQRIEQQFQRHVYFTDTNGKVMLVNRQALGLRSTMPTATNLSGPSLQLLNKSSNTDLTYQRGNATILANSRYIPELNWFLIVEQDEANAIAPFTRLLMINLTLAALATALALGLTVRSVNQHQANLERFATLDALSGTLNRSTGDAILEQACKDTNRNHQTMSVMMFDIDDFKRVNDTHGHAVGDGVIRTVARLAAEAVRTNDTLIRWGGEEFLIILKNCPSEQASVLAENIRKRIANHPFALNVPVTVSLGLAQYQPGEVVSTLTGRADAALYAAKRQGKNRVERASD